MIEGFETKSVSPDIESTKTSELPEKHEGEKGGQLEIPDEIGETEGPEVPDEVGEVSEPYFTDPEGNRCFTDSNGEVYRINDDLVANNTFELNGYKFETDDLGRIQKVEGQLQHKKDDEGRDKIRDDISVIGKGYEKETDDRGHIIGDQFYGPGGLGNLVPQDMNFNRGEYNRLETQLADAVKQGKEVFARIELTYPGDSYRPDSFRVNYTIDGERHSRVFSNGPGGV